MTRRFPSLLSLTCAAGAIAVLIAPLRASADTEYAYDDGVSNILLGPPSSFEQYGDIDMLWGNYYFTDNASELVSEIRFGMGTLSSPNVSVWIFEDSDDDADPTNATPIYNVTTTADNLGFDFNVVSIPNIQVDGGFFVAIGHLAELTYPNGSPDYPAPARFDPDGRPDRSWFFYDNDIPESNLASSGFVQRMDGPFVPIQGAFAVRAVTVPIPEPATAITMLMAIAGATLRRRR
ncbi:MAG TPA: PEP-CTERM sorting domain-containing protein [Phycisphaerae bacterium]|nr:PEP-CTERM sorting domain-containing protein [Phycisphaerae bacterium]HRW55981.1 PEP-CTERM sorting domain-containing protein [Phycisphaerae bacterium]